MKLFSFHFLLTFITDYLLLDYGFLPLPYNAASAVMVFLVIFIFLWLSSFFYRRSYFLKLPKAISLFFYFLRQLLLANLKIAYDIITPDYNLAPAVIALPLDLKTEEEITLLAILITLTPGTLSVDVRDDQKVLYVHALYGQDKDLDQMKNILKNGFERRILELTT